MTARRQMSPCLFGLLLGVLAGAACGGVPERFEIASEPIETPHVKWAKPLPGGPLRVLCFVPIPSQRDVVELAQRLDIDYELVAFPYPVMDADMAGAFHERLAGSAFDAILLSKVPLATLPEKTQELLVAKVREGTGLLNVHSTATLTTGEILNLSGDGGLLETALPLDLLPEGARPEVSVGRRGRGRCVQLTYPGGVTCFTPVVDFKDVDYRDWETYYQLLCRAVLWAAGRAPGVEILSVWPCATTCRQPADSWRIADLVTTRRPRLERAAGTWQFESIEERRALDTWRGYGATFAQQDGKLNITESNVRGQAGFAAGTFDIDLGRTPIVEVGVAEASRWSLFVPDVHFERAVATLQEETAETGAKRFDLREVQGLGGLRGQTSLTLCFATHGEGSSLVLDSLRFLTADGQTPADPSAAPPARESAGVTLRLQSAAAADAAITATYRGPDHYQAVNEHVERVSLEKSKPIERTFPLFDRSSGRPHTVDLVVRDARGRSLGFASAAYQVASPFALESWEAEAAFYRRGDRAVILAGFDNRSAPREVRLETGLYDMHGRLVAAETRTLTIAAGKSVQKVELPTAGSLTTLNRARLSVVDAEGLLGQAEACVYLPEPCPAWDDYLVSTSQFSNQSAYLRPHFSTVARDIGIEGMVIPPRYTTEVLQQAAPIMYWGAAEVRAFGYNFHGEETSTARRPCLSDPETRKKISEAYQKLGQELKPYGPLAIASLEDESELSGARYSNLEVCTSEHCTRRYRQWLEAQYKTIASLNAEWGASHGSFGQIEPMNFEEARQRENPAPWVDWRTFMEHVWLDALLLTRQGVKKHSPEVRMGFSNSFGQMPFSGWDYATLSRHVDMTIEYPTVIHRLTPPKEADAFEADDLPMNIAIRQKLDIRRSFMDDACPAPGWIWYDRTQQGAELKPWWMAFLGAGGCTPWGPTSLGVQSGASRMSFWAFIHPLLAHTRSSRWLADGVGDLTRGVGKIFVDYEKAPPRVAVLYSQPSMHLAWAWSKVERAFYPETDSLYAWYYKSRVNVTRLLREVGLSYRYVDTGQIDSGGLSGYRVLFLPCSLCLSDATLEQIRRFADNGGLVVADIGTGAADVHGKPLGDRRLVGELFGIRRTAVCRKVEPRPVAAAAAAGKLPIPKGLRLAGGDTITTLAAPRPAGADGLPAIVVNELGRGRAIYLNGFLGYNLPSRTWIRDLLDLAGLPSPARITSGGREQMGYESAVFSRGGIRLLGILRLRDEEHPTQVQLAERGHLYDVRSGKYFGLTDAATFDLSQKAAAVLASLPYAVRGIELRVDPQRTAAGGEVALGASVAVGEGDSGDHVLRVEVHDPSGGLSRAYTDNVLAVGGRWQGKVPTAANAQPGAWRVVVRDVISGSRAEAGFVIAEGE